MRAIVLFGIMACGRPAAEREPAADEAPVAEAPSPPVEQAPATRRVFFRSPMDGATVTSPVKLEFGVEGMELRPAGDPAPDSGHHHLIIADAAIPAGTAVPADEKHIHFGLAQTEAEVVLPPGTHRLTMQFADGNHVSYGEPMSATITITVAP